jgi:DNA-directed RNA polymerase subunit beta'
VESKSNGIARFVLDRCATSPTPRKEQVAISRNGEIVIATRTAASASATSCRTGRPLTVEDGAKVKAGQSLANWDPLTRPIITEYAGRDPLRERRGRRHRGQADRRDHGPVEPGRDRSEAPRHLGHQGPAPAVKLIGDKGKEVKLATGDTPVNYTFQIGAIITVKNGQQVNVGDVLARIPQESSKTRDITGGLPRVAELFEARSPKDAGLLAEITGTVSFGKDTKGKQRLIITDFDGAAHEYLIPKEKHITVHDGQVVNKGETIVDGPADPHDILRLQGMEALARYIIDEVQDVYRSRA